MARKTQTAEEVLKILQATGSRVGKRLAKERGSDYFRAIQKKAVQKRLENKAAQQSEKTELSPSE